MGVTAEVRLFDGEPKARLYTLQCKADHSMPFDKGAVVMPIARILAVSLVTSILVAGVGLSLLKSVSDPAIPAVGYTLPTFILACVGGLIGAVAGAAQEIVSAQRSKAANRDEVA
jgi:NAD/NADP transhydrogenase beta subunit